jgi:hypothetical protein
VESLDVVIHEKFGDKNVHNCWFIKPAKVRSTCALLLPKSVHCCCQILCIPIYRKLCIANCRSHYCASNGLN